MDSVFLVICCLFFWSSSVMAGEVVFDWEAKLTEGSLRSFPTYSEALSFLADLEREYKDLITSFVSGISLENRPLMTYHVGFQQPTDPNFGTHITEQGLGSSKCAFSKTDIDPELLDELFVSDASPLVNKDPQVTPTVLMFSLQHAREPISFVSLFYFIRRLLHMAASEGVDRADARQVYESQLAQYLVRRRHIIFHPLMNPDGYENIARNQQFFHRKNTRNTCNMAALSGVDLNRNFDFHFESGYHCDAEEYGGQHPFSEPESRAIKCLTDSFQIQSSVNVHAYGNFWTHPYNCCNNSHLPPELENVYLQMQRAMGISHFTSSGQSPLLNYTTTGEADDWLLGKRGIVATGPEIGPDNEGFWPPPDVIKATYRETYWSYLVVLLKTGPELGITLTGSSSSPKSELTLTNFGLASLEAPTRLIVYTCPNKGFCEKMFKEIPETASMSSQPYTPLPRPSEARFTAYEPSVSDQELPGYFYLMKTFTSKLLPQQRVVLPVRYDIRQLVSKTLVITVLDTDEKVTCYTSWVRVSDPDARDISISATLSPASESPFCLKQSDYLEHKALLMPNAKLFKLAVANASPSLIFIPFACSCLFVWWLFSFAVTYLVVWKKRQTVLLGPKLESLTLTCIAATRHAAGFLCCLPGCVRFQREIKAWETHHNQKAARIVEADVDDHDQFKLYAESDFDDTTVRHMQINHTMNEIRASLFELKSRPKYEHFKNDMPEDAP